MKEILIALAVVFAIGLFAGILLTLISRFFAVKEDEKVKEIRACLPGVNCGACGYKGCDDYALVVAEGKAKPNLCIPGAEDTANALGKILGVETETVESKVAFVHCNGNCEATSKKADYIGIFSCKAASMLYGGPNSCRFGCVGIGDCVSVCPQHAICLKDGIAHIDKNLCIGCGLCKDTCPKKIISMIPKSASAVMMCSSNDKGADARKACKNACIGCKKCEKICSVGAIKVIGHLASIDYGICMECGACVSACPTGALKDLIPSIQTIKK